MLVAALVPMLSSCVTGTGSSSERSHDVVISEINYHDGLGVPAGDFVEIHNTGTRRVGLNGWCIRGVDFCFDTRTTLEPGGYLVVTGDRFGGRLSNAGETIELVDAQRNVRDSVTYGTVSPWPETADGRGYSLHRTVGAADADTARAWEATEPTPGAAWVPRGEARSRADAGLVINEIHYHPVDDDPSAEFVELLNSGTAAVPLAGWCLPELDRCMSGGSLAPGGAVVVRNGSEQGMTNGDLVLRLVDPDGMLADIVPYEDRDQWPALADGHGHSLQRRDPMLSGVEPGNWVSAQPTPGQRNPVSGRGYLPAFRQVSHTHAPNPDQAMDVTAKLRDADSATLMYRIGFEPEVAVAMSRSATESWFARVPAQAAGTLIRYRLVARSTAGTGTWPRQGDGSRYAGTVVRSNPASKLPELKWFITERQYERAYEDVDQYGDAGYRSVFAFDGVVMDNARIRVKGNQSRLNQKRKWKVVLPAGHTWDMGGLLPVHVNEFSLHSAVTDKSFVREILTSDLQRMSGGIGQQVFPLRLSKNNEFFGLYLYVEQPDATWRNRQGFSPATLAFKAERNANLALYEVDLPRGEFAARYQKKTHRYADTHENLRSLIRAVNDPDEGKVLDFVRRHVDIPQVVEAIATMKIAQHLEWAHKNHHLFYDPADGKWRIVPTDFDLNFGRRFAPGCNALCEEVFVAPFPAYFSSNRLGSVFFRVPELRAMVDRRTRTLADAFYDGRDGRYVEERIAELAELIEEDAVLDRRRWYTYGVQESARQGQDKLIRNFVLPARRLFLGDARAGLPPSQATSISYRASGAGPVVVTNTDSVAIDLSGVRLEGLEGTVPSGTVLVPGQSAVFSNRRSPTPSGDDRIHVWVRESTLR